MAKPKLLLYGHRAFGDWVHTVPVLPYLFRDYEIHLDTNTKGKMLFHDDPRFVSKSYTELSVSKCRTQQDLQKLVEEHIENLKQKIQPDRVINLWQSLEVSCVAGASEPIFYRSLQDRRAYFHGRNFYENVFRHCGVPFPEGRLKLDEFYFSLQELTWLTRWRAGHKEQRVILMPVSGSCFHKIWGDAPRFVDQVLLNYPDTVVYLTGSKFDQPVFDLYTDSPRVYKVMDAPIKQVFLMTKAVDFVIGPETGVVLAAGMWGTPKILLHNMAYPEQLVKYQENDFSMLPDLDCAPCLRAVYTPKDCSSPILQDNGDNILKVPRCMRSGAYNFERTLEVWDKVYHTYPIRGVL